ncbi:MAG: hypothetical protein RBR65_08845 [Aliarcobacter sp.]|jgi:hypothetical protein|nr:hypothetical protein [Aliarcobacter sp.]
MENKIEFFEQNLKKIVKRDLNLKEQNIEINAKKTDVETIPFLIDFESQIVVIDGYFENLKTFWDTTNVEILAQKVKDKFEIEDIDEYRFYFFEKKKNKIVIIARNIDSTKILNYEIDID